MIKPILVPFRAEHAMSLIDRDTLTSMEISMAVERETRGPAYTAMLDDKVIGCSGVIVMWPGVGYAWASFTDDIHAHRIWATRVIKRSLHDIAHGLGLHRVEAVALCGDDRNQRWLEALGFRPESATYTIVEKYTSDQRPVRRYEFLP
jgi:hypothetical protein